MVSFVRRVLEAVLVLFVVGVLALAAASRVAPAAGYGTYAVRSASMAPSLAVGDLVIVQDVDPTSVQVGDVVTIALGNDTTVTHRVAGITPTDEGPVFTTRGDANASPDPVAARASQLRGVVVANLALIGYLLAMLSMPSGLAALFSIGATLLTTLWLLDELEAADDDDELDDLLAAPDPGPAPATL